MKTVSNSSNWIFNDIKDNEIDNFNRLLNEAIYSSITRFMNLFNRLYPKNTYDFNELSALYKVFKDYSLLKECN